MDLHVFPILNPPPTSLSIPSLWVIPVLPYFLRNILFILLHQVSVGVHGIFNCSMWDLVHQPGIEPRPPTLEAWCLSHWTTREVPILFLLMPKTWPLGTGAESNLRVFGEVEKNSFIVFPGKRGHNRPLSWKIVVPTQEDLVRSFIVIVQG